MILTQLALLFLVQAAPAAQLTPAERFFIGRVEGTGTARIIFSGTSAIRDVSHGRMERGALIIDQVVHQEGAAPRRRTWRLVRSGPNRFTGSISDVSGAVQGEVNGNVLHLRYRTTQGPTVEQWITMHPNGRTATNRMTFRRFGIQVATVEEVIRKVD